MEGSQYDLKWRRIILDLKFVIFFKFVVFFVRVLFIEWYFLNINENFFVRKLDYWYIML